MVNVGWPHGIRSFLANEICHFSRLSHQTGCIFTWTALSIESDLYSVTFACSGRLFCKSVWRQGLKFKLIFLRMQFSLAPTFFSLVLVICLSWYLHLKLSHDLLTLVSFNIWRYNFTSRAIYLTLCKPNGLSKCLKDQSIWTGPKYKCKAGSYMDSTKVLLRDRLNLGFNLNYFSFLL